MLTAFFCVVSFETLLLQEHWVVNYPRNPVTRSVSSLIAHPAPILGRHATWALVTQLDEG